MLDEKNMQLGNEPSAIRELFAYGMQRKAEIGNDKVFDYSLGNPSVPAPAEVADALRDILDMDPVALHSYSPAPGLPSTREAVAQSIRKNFDFDASPDNVYLTHGAAACLAIAIQAVSVAGEEVIVPTPYFPEYRTWVEAAGATLVEVPCERPSFQLDVDAIAAAISPKTAAIIVNTPNNPVGSVYTRENLVALADVLRAKERELGTTIYLIADEPYRAISYGAEIPFIPALYDRTIVCYSFSKSLSLPGERIGYVYVSDTMDNARDTCFAIAGAARALGYVCASVLFQRMLERCIDLPSDVESYRENREILTRGLREIGYEFVEPEGAFYLWVKALEPDANAFSERAKDYELLVVPSDSFGCTGYVRLSYCIAKKTIEDSLPAFKKLFESYSK